jgi:CDP-glucose 4,6-dehydratase
MSIRPWQHVLDPLWGYFLVLDGLINGKEIKNMNFALAQGNLTVGEVVEIAKREWGVIKVRLRDPAVQRDFTPSEATNLDLNASIAQEYLKWRPSFDQITAIRLTVKWWQSATVGNVSVDELVKLEIADFLNGKEID